MSKGLLNPFAILALLGGFLVVAVASVFTLDQTQLALVLRFGEPVSGRGLMEEPGLHFKIPFFENVVYVDKRILSTLADNEEVLASDNQRLLIDSFVLYHIVNPLLFYQTVQNEARANNQLASILNSSVRRILSEANLNQIVRDDRIALMGKIKDQVNIEAKSIGVAIDDVRITRADFPPEISEKVYMRMQSERAREAAEYRAQGAEQAQIIQANADREVIVLKAEAYQKANEIKGQGEAERSKIYLEAIHSDPEFFSFYRSMQAYDNALNGQATRYFLSPKSEFFRYFDAKNVNSVSNDGTK